MIVGVAIKHRKTGEVFSLPKPARHDSVIKALVGIDEREWARGIQGFITNTGKFLTREESLDHVVATMQPTTATGKLCGSILFSEDVW